MSASQAVGIGAAITGVILAGAFAAAIVIGAVSNMKKTRETLFDSEPSEPPKESK